MADTLTLAQLNAAGTAEFVARLGGIFEHSPWVAEGVVDSRPFESVAQLHADMVAAVEGASDAARLELLRAHPELAGKAAQQGELTEASTSEQRSAGLNDLSPAQMAEVGRLNRAYRERFGFPFIIAVRDNTRDQIFDKWHQRLGNDAVQERRAALQQVYLIAQLRLEALVER